MQATVSVMHKQKLQGNDNENHKDSIINNNKIDVSEVTSGNKHCSSKIFDTYCIT